MRVQQNQPYFSGTLWCLHGDASASHALVSIRIMRHQSKQVFIVRVAGWLSRTQTHSRSLHYPVCVTCSNIFYRRRRRRIYSLKAHTFMEADLHVNAPCTHSLRPALSLTRGLMTLDCPPLVCPIHTTKDCVL
jgi:hypothetical protein